MSKNDLDFFVPGRICLFGEHSDWAGGYRRVNSAIAQGNCIICGTNQGLYSRAKKMPNRLIFRSIDSSGAIISMNEPMEGPRLLAVAQEGGYWSYVAGVAYQALSHYNVGGIEIDNYKSDLPLKKGLSSSAATCVLVARAFNRLYDLKLTTKGEMDLAYRGEITTPSRCGRMDQGCAYGNKPIVMRFDGDSIDIDELAVGTDLFLVIVDLKGKKDTVKILAALNKAYPFPEDDLSRNAHAYLGKENEKIVQEARVAIHEGDASKLGMLMSEAQRRFDDNLGPLCPDELVSPKLHELLNNQTIQHLIWGGKGVGSQGDGCAQFVTRGESEQQQLIHILSTLGYGVLPMTIPRTKKIKKAIITAAGFGTRLFPMTSIVRKEFLPIVEPNGRMLPLLLANIEEAFDAGIEEIAIIIQEADKATFEKFLDQALPLEHYNALSDRARQESAKIRERCQKVILITQAEQRGLGHAISLAREWVGNQPFLLVLGDHLFVPNGNMKCAKQLVGVYNEIEANLIGVQETVESEVGRFGTVTGNWVSHGEGNELLFITKFKEKPSTEYAREFLKVEGVAESKYLTVFGLYVLTPGVLDELERRSVSSESSGEIQLTDALEHLRKNIPFFGYIVEGKKIDIGIPEGYLDGINLYFHYSNK